jgi:hypothetical protein
VSQELKARPFQGQVRPVELPLQYASGDVLPSPEGKPEGDRVEMRQYTPGDPLKLVLWKVYARTGKMMVRLPERSLSPVERTLVYLVAGRGDEPSAGVACALVEERAFGEDLFFGADGTPEVARTVPETIDRIILSSQARDRGGEGLEDFLAQGESAGYSSCLLFVPARPGGWLLRVEALAALGRCRFHALVGVDGEPTDKMRSWWQRFLFAENSDRSNSETELKEVCRRLRDAGIEWTVVDRLSGRTIEIEAA